MTRTARLITRSDESMLKLWLLQHDPDLAFHQQLNNYFLADTDQFGALGVFENDQLTSIGLFSKFNGASYLHRQYGSTLITKELIEFLGDRAEIFVVHGQTVENGLNGWTEELKTTPGMIIDHPAYSGVFWRTVPWYYGVVYRKGF